MTHKMSKAEAKAWEDLAKAARRVQMFQTRRKNAKGKPKLTREQRQELERKRIEFANSLDLDPTEHWTSTDVSGPWYKAAREAMRLGLYSKKSYVFDVAASLRYKKWDTENAK